MEIIDGIFLGDIQATKSTECDAVLSLYNLPLDLSKFGEKKLVYKVEDSPTTDLLTEFPRMIQFINHHRQNDETVLIHCQAGSSRSVTVLIAYLMSSGVIKTTLDGIKLIVSKGGSPNPNDGFMDQLDLWDEMGSKIQKENSNFKKYRLEMLQEDMMISNWTPKELDKLCGETPSERDPKAFKCKKCRRALFLPAAIIPHEENSDTKAFVTKNKNDRKPKGTCSSVFVEPIEWMEEIRSGRVKGLLYCPKCRQKVGHFDWAGVQCSCGKWVSPAIQVHRKQTDGPPGHF